MARKWAVSNSTPSWQLTNTAQALHILATPVESSKAVGPCDSEVLMRVELLPVDFQHLPGLQQNALNVESTRV